MQNESAKSLPVRIRSTGCFIPSVQVASSELDRQFGFEPGFLEQATGVQTRYYGNEKETSPYMGARAAADALRRAELSVRDLDAFISVSSTYAQLVPCTATLILEQMGEFDAGIAAFDINATCLGFLVGFDIVAHLIAAGRYSRVLLVAAEANSVLLSPTQWESSALLGDGAVAVLLEATTEPGTSRVVCSKMVTYPRGAHLCETRALGTTLHPNGSRKPEGEDHCFRMDGLELASLAYSLAPEFHDAFLKEAQQCLSDFDLIVPHQASGPALRLLMHRFRCPAEKVFTYLKDFGNLASASIPLGIHLATEEGRLKRGDNVLLVGTGAGMSIGALSLVY